MSIFVMAPVLRADIPSVPAREGRRPDSRGCDGQTLKLVLLGLADGSDEKGRGARRGLRTLAMFAQCHTQTAGRALVCLEELGAIRRITRGGGKHSAAYDIDMAWVERAVERAERLAEQRYKKPQVEAHCAPEARNGPIARPSEARKLRAPEARSNARSRGAHKRPDVLTSPDEPVSRGSKAGPATGGISSRPTVEKVREIWQAERVAGRQELADPENRDPEQVDPEPVDLTPWITKGITFAAHAREQRKAGKPGFRR